MLDADFEAIDFFLVKGAAIAGRENRLKCTRCGDTEVVTT